MIIGDYHTHTTYCDGDNTPEEMLFAAIDKGLKYYGFSSHSHLSYDEDWNMSFASQKQYVSEIRSLKEKYKDKITVLLGTEYDLLTGKLTAYTEGVKIDRAASFKGSQRARQVYGELLAAAEALLALVKTRKGCTNKDNAKLTAQIRNLIEKWK